MLLSPCIAFNQLLWSLCSWAHWSVIEMARKRLTDTYGTSYLVHHPLLMLLIGDFSHLTQISSHLVPIQRSLSTYTFPSPNLQFSKFLHCIPSKSLTIQLKYWPLLRKQCWYTSLALSPSRQNKQPGTLFSAQPTGRISFLYCPSQFIPGQGSSTPDGHFQGILKYCTEPSINWASLFFLCQLVIENSTWDHRCKLRWKTM